MDPMGRVNRNESLFQGSWWTFDMSGLDPWRLHTGLHNKILQKRHLPDVSYSDVAAGKSESEKLDGFTFDGFVLLNVGKS